VPWALGAVIGPPEEAMEELDSPYHRCAGRADRARQGAVFVALSALTLFVPAALSASADGSHLRGGGNGMSLTEGYFYSSSSSMPKPKPKPSRGEKPILLSDMRAKLKPRYLFSHRETKQYQSQGR
ncbi:hypothetical protein THAOC_09346, partial [Thalassiosira oceanica]